MSEFNTPYEYKEHLNGLYPTLSEFHAHVDTSEFVHTLYSLIEKNCLQALKCHCSLEGDLLTAHLHGIDLCTEVGCPYGPHDTLPDCCEYHFLDYLSDLLRAYANGNKDALDLADVMEKCCYGDSTYENCCDCPYFQPCFIEDDFDFMLKKVYDTLRSSGAYKE